MVGGVIRVVRNIGGSVGLEWDKFSFGFGKLRVFLEVLGELLGSRFGSFVDKWGSYGSGEVISENIEWEKY